MPRISVAIEPYSEGNPYVHRMIVFLQSHLKDDLFGAYVHGSLATGEEIPYSDFDALAIVREAAMRDPARRTTVLRKLRQAEEIMFAFDPLQHHGWFKLTEMDLATYDDTYFPHELFAFSRSIFSARGSSLTLDLCDRAANRHQSFSHVARNLHYNIRSGRVLRNLYHLKNTLSLFMLLPALYVQARDGRGIYKKFSFESARPDFSDQDWEPMLSASRLREDWSYDISPLRRWLLSRPWRIRRQLVRHFAPCVPADLRSKVTVELRAGMARLAAGMAEALDLPVPIDGA